MTDEIRAEIRARGPMPFERFMELALYGDEGFYMRPGGGSAGRRGDFITSPEVGPLFGAVLARYLDAEWSRLGRPDRFTVVDAGAGPGTLARAVLAARPECLDALDYVAVEISPAQRERHPDVVRSVASLDDVVTDPPDDGSTSGDGAAGDPAGEHGRVDGVVVANELLDNVPFRLAVFDSGWREAFVDVGTDGRFVELLSAPLDPLPVVLPRVAAHGARAPLVDRAAATVDRARALVRQGSVVVIDYATARTADLAARPWREWLRTYRNNERGEHYLASPGTQDITIDVPLDQFPEPDALRTQAQFLQRWGIDELVEEGRRVWSEQAARPGLEALQMRSRVSEAAALLDAGGLGAFMVAEWRAD